MQTRDMPNEEEVREALRNVVDPEVGLNIVDLGLVYDVEVAPGRVRVALTMTTPACPMSSMISDDAVRAIRAIAPDDAEIDLQLVWDPPWDASMMSESARQHFGWPI